MMVSANRLKALLEPLGFSMRWASLSTKEIDFVRPSIIGRLYEH
jgi:hypothetical protein